MIEVCCVCGKPITDSVNYATSNLKHRWHIRCDKDRWKWRSAFNRTLLPAQQQR